LTVAVSCNLSDGVILGVDSAITVASAGGVAKVYEQAEKLFQLGNLPIGVATFGLGGIRTRTIGSYLREFEMRDPNSALSARNNLGKVVEELRSFFYDTYMDTVAVDVQKETGKPISEVPEPKRPKLGFVVGGFSPDSFLSEVWGLVIPTHDKPNSADQIRKPGEFGTNWFASYEPIQRYIKGYTIALADELVGYFVKQRRFPLTQSEQNDIGNLLSKFEYRIPYSAMPIREGIEHVRFLVGMVVNHHRFAVGAPIVGGKVNIGLVTYKGEQFRILHEIGDEYSVQSRS